MKVLAVESNPRGVVLVSTASPPNPEALEIAKRLAKRQSPGDVQLLYSFAGDQGQGYLFAINPHSARAAVTG